MGLSQNCAGNFYYVYIPDFNEEYLKENGVLIIPKTNQVPDVKITEEIWVTVPIKIHLIGIIKCTKDKGLPGHSFKYGKNNEFETELFD